jgi:hypothetical protein
VVSSSTSNYRKSRKRFEYLIVLWDDVEQAFCIGPQFLKIELDNVYFLTILSRRVIQLDISGHPPFPSGSKQLSSNFDNLLFLTVFWVLNFRSHFEALNDVEIL